MIIWDTETTGLVGPIALPLSKQPQIIELACIKLDDKTLKEVDRLDMLINPGKPLPPEIIKITGLTDAKLKGKPSFTECLNSISNFFLGERISIAHNLSFDTSMLKLELSRLDMVHRFPWPSHLIDTVEETFHLKGKRIKLTHLHEICFGAPFDGAHRAMVDVEALTKCVIWLIKESHITLPKF